jgi:hypothetical protein
MGSDSTEAAAAAAAAAAVQASSPNQYGKLPYGPCGPYGPRSDVADLAAEHVPHALLARVVHVMLTADDPRVRCVRGQGATEERGQVLSSFILQLFPLLLFHSVLHQQRQMRSNRLGQDHTLTPPHAHRAPPSSRSSALNAALGAVTSLPGVRQRYCAAFADTLSSLVASRQVELRVTPVS